MLEHRYSVRKTLYLKVVVKYHGQRLVRGLARDIGIGGMHVESGGAPPPLNAVVEAVLFLPTSGIDRMQTTEAVVVHHQGGGFGLMFTDITEELHHLLHDIVFLKGVPPNRDHLPLHGQ